MSERGAVTGGKRGVQGWRAFLLVFGCGTLAALLMFGAIVGILRLVFGVGSSDSQAVERGDGVTANPTGEPQSTLPPGKLDLCSTTVATISRINVSRVDSGDDYVDSDLEGGGSQDSGRIVSDQCEWALTPDYSHINPWDLSLSYEAIISSSEGEVSVDDASRDFDTRKDDLASRVSSVENEGEAQYADRSYFVYGESADEPGLTTYVILAQTRSAVYEIQLDAQSDDNDSDLVPEAAFDHEVEKLASRIDMDLNLWIPEDG